VLGHDLQPVPTVNRTRGMKGFLVADPIHVVGTGFRNQLACDLILTKEHLEDRRIDLFGWLDFLRRPEPVGPRVLGDVVSNKPSAESSERDFMNRRVMAPFQCN